MCISQLNVVSNSSNSFNKPLHKAILSDFEEMSIDNFKTISNLNREKLSDVVLGDLSNDHFLLCEYCSFIVIETLLHGLQKWVIESE